MWSGFHDNFAQSENLAEAVEKFVEIEEKSYKESFGMDISIKAIVKHIFDEFRVKLSEILSQDTAHNDFAIHMLKDGNAFVRARVEHDIKEESASVSKN
jgi:transcriptional regulator